MSDQGEKREVSLAEMSQAIDLVGLLMAQVSIPGSKAGDWSAAGRVLGDLKAFLDHEATKVAAAPASKEPAGPSEPAQKPPSEGALSVEV